MRLGAIAAASAAVGAGCVAYGTFVESRAFRLKRILVPVLPPGAHPVTILHLSDLHLYPGQRAKREWVARLGDLQPDLVLNTGDNLSHPDVLDDLRETLGTLIHRPGAFVLGSNDFHAPVFKSPLSYFSKTRKALPHDNLPTAELRAVLSSGGWIDLEGQRATLTARRSKLELIGTGDAHIDRDDYTAVAGSPQEAAVRIGVTHAPYLRVLDAMVRDDVDVMFAGHTHGGQVCVPGYGALVTNCDIEPARVKGLSTHSADGKTAWLHVSAGLGMSPFAPFRFACPPEATLVTLIPRTE